jgi:hypothetical protein
MCSYTVGMKINFKDFRVIAVLAFLLFAGVLLVQLKRFRDHACPGPIERFEIADSYLRGVLEQGATARVQLRTYQCRPLIAGEIVMVNRGAKLPPIARIVRAVAGDQFHLIPNVKQKAWNIEINGRVLMNESTPFFFGDGIHAHTLGLYEKAHGGYLQPNHFIIFSTWAPGDYDSSIYGVFNTKEIIGKVILEDALTNQSN